MAKIKETSVPVTTFAKRQRRISSTNHNSKNQINKETSVVTELSFEDMTTHEEKDIKTPTGSSRQAASKETFEPMPTVSPSMKLYFDLVDKEELLVEEANSDDDES